MPLFESAFIAGLKSVLTSALYPVLPFLLVLFWHGDKKTRKTRFVHAVIFAFVFTLLFTIMNALGGSGIVRLTANSYFIYAIVFFLLYFALAFARLLPAKITPRFLTQPPTLVSLFALSSFAALFAIAFMGNSVSSLLVQVAKAMQVQTNVLLPLFAVFLFAFAVEFPLLLVSFLLITLPSKPEWQKYMRYAISTLFIAAAFHYAEDSVGNFPDAAQAFPFAAIGFGMCVTFYLLADPALSDASMPRRLKINTSGMLLLSGLGLFLFTSLFVKYWGFEVKTDALFQKSTPIQSTMTLPEGRLKWYANLEEAKKIAAKENKILFIDFWADWCGACAEMEKKLFTHDEFINFAIEKNILPVRIDYSAPTEELDVLAQKYHIRGLPTVVLTKSNGELIHTLMGFYNKSYTMRELRSALRE